MAENARNAEREKKLEQKYDELSKDTSSELLPSVLIPINEHKPFSFTAAVLTRMDQECAIEKAQHEQDNALLEAKIYRDLADELKKDKRELAQAYAGRVAMVRDFWRNKIIEGDSRGGRLLRASLLQNRFSYDNE